MASWFTRAIDTITPWDRGGEVQRRQERKRREEENQGQQPNRPAPRDYTNRFLEVESENNPNIKVNQPKNNFATLKVDNQLGKLNNTVSVFDTPTSQPVTPPTPGTIVKPKQSVFDKVRDQFDANTQADQYRREQGNLIKGEQKPLVLDDPGNIVGRTPIVGHVVKTLNTLGNQIPQVGFTAQGLLASNEYSNAMKSGDRNRIDAASHRVQDINRLQDASNSMFQKNKGGLFNTGTLFDSRGAQQGDLMTGAKDIVAPTAVSMLDLYTLGKGNVISSAISKNGVKAGLSSQVGNLAKTTSGNFASGGIDTKAQGGSWLDALKSGALNSLFGGAADIALPGVFKALKNKIKPDLYKSETPSASGITTEIDNSAIAATAEKANQAMTPRPITVTKNIPVDTPIVPDQPVNVRVMTQPKPLIKEVTGDATMSTPDAVVQRSVNDARAKTVVNNYKNQPAGLPDHTVEGITKPKTDPYQLTGDTVKKSQDAIIDDYAKILEETGQGNGVHLIPNGEKYGWGKTRISNNYRDPSLKGKRMTKTGWRNEAQRQLAEGRGEPGLQQAYKDASNPEVQSLLAKGEQPEVPIGKPITVKESKGIPVRDETMAPQGLPEQPGMVRATTATAPAKAETEAIASQPTVTPPSSSPKEAQAVLDNPKQQVADVEVPVATIKPIDNISPARRDLIYSLKEANKQSVRDARALSVARGERAGKATSMSDGLEGEAATRARKAGFKGELGHRGQYVGIGGEDGEKIFNDLRLEAQRNPELAKRVYTLDNVEESLSRAIRGTDLKGNTVGAPTKSQIDLLRKYFGEDVGDAIDGAVNLSKGFKDKALEAVGKTVATPRAIMSSLDFSAFLRQGGVLGSRFPKEAAKAVKEQLSYFASSKSFKEGMEEIANRASYDTMIKSGLDVTGTRGIAKAEEAFIDNFAGNIPVLGRGVDASERAYTGFLTKVRADVFDKVRNGYLEQGIELPQKELDDLAKFINTASGRGSLGKLEDHAKTLSTTLFSPRLWKSRLDMLNPMYYAKLSGPAKKLALQSAGTYASIAGTVLGLAAAAGANVESDLRSSDFGKIRVGNNRYDVLGGFQQNLVFAWRELTGEKKSSTTAEVTKFARGIPDLIKGRSDEDAGVQTGPYTPNRVSVASDLVGNKANPVLGAMGRILSGKDRGGNPVNPLEELARMAVPFSISGAWDAANDIGNATNPIDFAKGALINSPDLVGISSQVYGETPTKDKNYNKYAEAKDRATKLRDEGALTDTKKIKEAYDNADYESVIKGNQYLKAKAEANPKTTEKDLASIDKSIKESTYLKDGVPKTDDGITAKIENSDWDKAIKGYQWKIERAKSDGEISQKTENDIKNDIKRLEVNRDNAIKPELFNDYKSIGVTDWRKMGDPDSEDYDPDKYQKLWDIDQTMTKAGVSYKKGDLTKNKYYSKTGGSGGRSGGSGSKAKSLSVDFGKLSAKAPKIKEYETLAQTSGAVPIIRRKQPNIVHAIKSGKV